MPQYSSNIAQLLRSFEEIAEQHGLKDRLPKNLFDSAPESPSSVLTLLCELADEMGYRFEISLESKFDTLQKISYPRIANVLAQNYFSIYYVDIKSDHYIEYSSNPQYRELNIKSSGENFFEDARKNIVRVLHPEDRKRMTSYLNKKTLLAELEGGKTFSVSYRLLFDGKPVYVNLKALYLDSNDPQHILIGVSNIDALKKREENYRKALGNAQKMATRDALTGVLNKHAYIDYEEALDARIRSKEPLQFAIVVFDVNDLKGINDNFGHQTGDSYIREACSCICAVFRNSPVFRVGGDEFAAILQEEDYRDRHALLAEMDRAVSEHIALGKVVVASGFAEFDPMRDGEVSAVFERADTAMYLCKKKLKKDYAKNPTKKS